MVIMLDPSKRVFLSPNCIEDGSITNYLFKTLQDHSVPKNNIFTEINMDLVRSGDYLVRCIDNVIKVLEINFIPPFGFITKYYGMIGTSS
jgi:hypothetical protein